MEPMSLCVFPVLPEQDTCQRNAKYSQGIIAADPINAYNISGVAYSSSISAYRIFGCEGYVTDDGLFLDQD